MDQRQDRRRPGSCQDPGRRSFKTTGCLIGNQGDNISGPVDPFLDGFFHGRCTTEVFGLVHHSHFERKFKVGDQRGNKVPDPGSTKLCLSSRPGLFGLVTFLENKWPPPRRGGGGRGSWVSIRLSAVGVRLPGAQLPRPPRLSDTAAKI